MSRATTIMFASVLALFTVPGCDPEGDGDEACGHEGGEHEGGHEGGEGNEHGDGGEGGDEGGEENGTQYQKNETHDEVRKGSHLILSYDEPSNSFVGTVENVSNETLDQVRVEVHLSNGTELGPTPDVSLEPGQIEDVELEATTEPFETWSAHAEVGADEHGSGCE